MPTVTVQGVTISVPPGARLHVSNGTIYIDGERHEGMPTNLTGRVQLEVQGDIGELRVDNGDATGNGSCRAVMASGDVTVRGPVGTNAQSGGDLSCEDVGGNVMAGGDVTCQVVRGSVKAGGDINHRRG